jgi:3-phosphoshikimate 1-carboxyvinyltransferase
MTPEAASAQIKSAILLAALAADGTTTVHEAVATRDHTERMIRSFGGALHREGPDIRINGPQTLKATRVSIPGDPSSAAPFVVAALVLPDSEVVIEGLLLNPHRIRYLDVLRDMGARIETQITSPPDAAEASGRIIVRASELRGIDVSPSDVAAIVDELPILAVAGAFARGRFRVTGAGELRVKESDRIASMVEGLQAMGADIQELADGFTLQGGGLRGATVGSHGDHRIAMALSVAALGAKGDSEVLGAEAVSISLPDFFPELERGARR